VTERPDLPYTNHVVTIKLGEKTYWCVLGKRSGETASSGRIRLAFRSKCHIDQFVAERNDEHMHFERNARRIRPDDAVRRIACLKHATNGLLSQLMVTTWFVRGDPDARSRSRYTRAS